MLVKEKAVNQPRIDRDGDGTLDDVFIPNVDSVHLEKMDTDHWWIGVYMKGEVCYHFNVTATTALHVSMEKVEHEIWRGA